MKTLALFEHRPENVSNHNRSTNGWVFHKSVQDEQEFYNTIKDWEDQDFFEQEGGTVTDQDGNDVFDPEYPTEFDFHDYKYQLVAITEMNSDQMEAIHQSNHQDAETMVDKLALDEEY